MIDKYWVGWNTTRQVGETLTIDGVDYLILDTESLGDATKYYLEKISPE